MGKKIKIAYITKNLVINGITNVIMNYSMALDKESFDITVISGKPIAEEIKNLCVKFDISLIELPSKLDNTNRYYFSLARCLRNAKYDIVHIHGNSATIAIELLIAKLCCCKVRIAHCHNSTCDNLRAHKLLYPLFKHLYTLGFACSNEAGNWLFRDDNYQILCNAFDTEKFKFDCNKRDVIRKKLNLDNKYVVLAVGRVNNQKNYPYLLNIFEEIAKIKDNAWLIIAGDGPNLEDVESIINVHPYRDRIIYYGVTSHVEELYCAADVFVLPSKFEGLGIVFIEAQISGLPVVTSDRVPAEVDIGGRVQFLSLEENISVWRDAVIGSVQIDRESFYASHLDGILAYDINNNAAILSKLYLDMLE